MSSHSHSTSPSPLCSAADLLRFVPSPVPPDNAARERFAKRRAAGRIAESMAGALGRGAAEAGTARLATVLAAQAGVLQLADRPRTDAALAAEAVEAAVKAVHNAAPEARAATSVVTVRAGVRVHHAG